MQTDTHPMKAELEIISYWSNVHTTMMRKPCNKVYYIVQFLISNKENTLLTI